MHDASLHARARLTLALLAIALVSEPTTAKAELPDQQTTNARAATGPRAKTGTETASTDRDAAIASGIFRARSAPSEILWQIMSVPQHLVELVFTPLAILVTAVERNRVDRRVRDFLRNDSGTVKVTPQFKISVGEGAGAGATLSLDGIGGGDTHAGALARVNGDFEAAFEYERRLAFLEGRIIHLTAFRERDQNLRYYGLSNSTTSADKRVLESNVFETSAVLDVAGRGSMYLTGSVEMTYRHERLSRGTDPAIDSVGNPGDTVAPPLDFGSGLDYGSAGFRLRYDSRDTLGRPTRGAVWQAQVRATQQLARAVDFSALSAEVTVHKFIPLLPDHRALVLNAGLRVSGEFIGGDDTPLFELTMLGRDTHLRGYSKDRFRADHGWWAGAEYRFPIYEYLNTGGAIDAGLFVDLGRVATGTGEFVSGPVRYSWGLALRGGYDAAAFFSLQLGTSPEGPHVSFVIGSEI